MSWNASRSASGVWAVSRSTSPPSAVRPREVAALAVGRACGRRPPATNGQPLGRDPGEDPRVEHRPEVVGVRHERVAVAALEQRREHARGDAAPGRCRRARAGTTRAPGPPATPPAPARRRASFGSLFWTKSSGHVGRQPVVAARAARASRRASRTSSSARAAAARRLASRSASTWRAITSRNGQPVLDLEQRLRPRHPHARAEPAVELDHDRLVERRRRALGERRRRRAGRATGSISASADQPGLARLELLVVVREGGDRRVRDARRARIFSTRGPQPAPCAATLPDAWAQPRR